MVEREVNGGSETNMEVISMHLREQAKAHYPVREVEYGGSYLCSPEDTRHLRIMGKSQKV